MATTDFQDQPHRALFRNLFHTRWRLQFSPAVEYEYRKDHASKSLPFVRACLILAIGIYAVFGVLTPWLYPESYFEMFVITYGIMCPLLSVFFTLTFFSFYWKLGQCIVFVQAFAITLGVLALVAIVHPTEPAFPINYVGLILTVESAFTLGRLRLSYAVLLTVFILLGYAFICIVIQGRHQSPEMLIPFLNNLFYLISAAIISVATGYLLEFYLRRDFVQRRQIEAEKRRTEEERHRADQLLLRILPADIAAELKSNTRVIADDVPEASVLFADIVDFTPLCAQLPAADIVALLDDVFSGFDTLVEKHGLEKIKTIGDCYMVAAGVPRSRPDHAHCITNLALDFLNHVNSKTFGKGYRLRFRIGINSGPLVAGVIGKNKFIYDLWGDTVNTASRMESQGFADGIQIACATYKRIKDAFVCEPKGSIQVKGRGSMEVWSVCGKRNDTVKAGTVGWKPASRKVSGLPND